MLQLIKWVWLGGVNWRSRLSLPVKSEVTIRSQKWLGPAESLRVVDVEIDGTRHRLALWNTKTSAQMLELASPSTGVAARGAAC